MWVSPEDEIQQGPARPELHPGPPAAPHPSPGGRCQGFPCGEPRHGGGAAHGGRLPLRPGISSRQCNGLRTACPEKSREITFRY